MKKIFALLVMIVLLSSTAFISGCARGENDPWLTLHTRDGRLTQLWSLSSISGSVVETTNGNTVNIEYYFDGTYIYITTDGETESYSYQYDMDIQNNGDVFSQEFMNDIDNNNVVSQSSKTGYWYWGDDEQNKTSVNLDLTGLLSKYLSYDLPRLAWNDMTMNIDYSDNYTTLEATSDTTSAYVAGSKTVSLELKWDVNLTGL